MAEQAQVAQPMAPEKTTPPTSPRGAKASSEGAEPRIAGLTYRQLAALFGVIFLANFPLLHYVTRGEAPVTTSVPFTDDFSRDTIGPHYFSTGGHWRIENGELHSPGVKNNPLWLQAKLPADVAVEFDARSESADGDIKAEIFGNGRDHASGYVAIFGGWSNSINTLARLDEHGRDRKEDRSLKVERGRTYRFRLERKGSVLNWYVDGKLLLSYDDPKPLRGEGHDRFGFSSWDSDLYFDNLKIEPL